MVGNNPQNYYIAAVFFALFAIFLGWRAWLNHSAENNISAGLYFMCAILCLLEVVLLIRNGKRRARGIPPGKRM